MAQSRIPALSWDAEDSVGGGRRKKVFGYLKAANELRQTYTAQLTAQKNSLRSGYGADYINTPGAFSDIEISRTENEEMVMFPSYGRRLVRGGEPGWSSHARRDSSSSIDDYHRSSDESDRVDEYESMNAVVDVDVRGWIYAPHRGPMTRKHRLMIALARKLSGVPAPNVNPNGGAVWNADQESPEKGGGRVEEEAVDQEIRSIMSKAERDADPAWKASLPDNQGEGAPGRLARTTTTPDPSSYTRDELSIANAHLMERLQPFMSNPMVDMPVTAFFFNSEQSQSRNILTDESGHFSIRAGLPFVPTHVRVLASEKLSAAKEVEMIEPTGVSLISDIDDTVKHSAIASGAKEIFRNTFVRELGELIVDGVAEWYSKLVNMGVEFHYVSNAPWQLYPLLDRYFKMVGLPPGSFHMKQYSGMLQGIFEPAAEKKKIPLERILRDFPDRRFILVGDSGEADLEVYTDIALANPGRILGIFIRDVTTPNPKKFFEKSFDHWKTPPHRSRTTGHLDTSNAIPPRPALPPRRPREQPDAAEVKSVDNADLIDLQDYEIQKKVPEKPANLRAPPAKPAKPSTLRTVSTSDGQGDSARQESIARKPVPPVPPRRQKPAPSAEVKSTEQEESSQSTPMGSYITPVKNAVSTVSNAIPAATEYLPIPSSITGSQPAEGKKQPPPVPPPRRTNTGASTPNSYANNNTPTVQKPQSYPAAAVTAAGSAASSALNYASNWVPSPANALRSTASSTSLGRTNTSSPLGGPIDQEDDPGSGYSTPQTPLPNKREELWRRRWERADQILTQQGVVLGSWRVGQDAQDVCMWLAKEALNR